MLSAFLSWHTKQLDRIRIRLGLSHYQIAWVAFFKGALVGIILGWWIFG